MVGVYMWCTGTILSIISNFARFVDMYLRSYLFVVCDTALRSDSFGHLYNDPEDYQHDN
jgi:hypothetical protein